MPSKVVKFANFLIEKIRPVKQAVDDVQEASIQSGNGKIKVEEWLEAHKDIKPALNTHDPYPEKVDHKFTGPIPEIARREGGKHFRLKWSKRRFPFTKSGRGRNGKKQQKGEDKPMVTDINNGYEHANVDADAVAEHRHNLVAAVTVSVMDAVHEATQLQAPKTRADQIHNIRTILRRRVDIAKAVNQGMTNAIMDTCTAAFPGYVDEADEIMIARAVIETRKKATAAALTSLGTLDITQKLRDAVYTAVKEAIIRTLTTVMRPVNEREAACNRLIFRMMTPVIAMAADQAATKASTDTVKAATPATMAVSSQKDMTDAIAEALYCGVRDARRIFCRVEPQDTASSDDSGDATDAATDAATEEEAPEQAEPAEVKPWRTTSELILPPPAKRARSSDYCDSKSI